VDSTYSQVSATPRFVLYFIGRETKKHPRLRMSSLNHILQKQSDIKEASSPAAIE
jgi:hypothetical protein